jgi:hypothetical protein
LAQLTGGKTNVTIEQLKQQLAEGKITVEQFKAELQKLLSAGTITQEQHDEAVNGAGQAGGGGGGGNDPLTAEQIQAMIDKASQSAADKVRTEYSQKKKELEDQLEALKKEKMSDEEKAKYEREKFERDLKEREDKLQEREIALHTVDKLTELKLPLSFKSILAGKTTEETDSNITAFQTEWQRALDEAISERFKQNPGNPGKGNPPSGDKNPWSKDHWNMTEQGKLLRADRAKAIQMAALHGFTISPQ